MTLNIHIFTTSDLTVLLADYTRFGPPDFSTGKNGFAACEIEVPMSLSDAFGVLDWPGVPHVVVSDNTTAVIWEGRLEKTTLIDGGIRLEAYGYWQAMKDLRYTALWSDTITRSWNKVTTNQLANRVPEKYVADNNARLLMGLRKNETYTNGGDVGAWYYRTPDSGEKELVHFECDYTFDAPNGWRFRVATFVGFASQAVDNVIDSAGSPLSGSLSLTLTSGKDAIHTYIYNNTGSNYTWTGETGAAYLELTNIRITTETTPILASTVATDLITYVNAENSSQLQSSTALVEATTQDLYNETYEDETPAKVLDYLAELHLFEVGVWENRTLHFREKGSEGRTFYIDATRITDVSKDLSQIYNDVYAVYQDENRRSLRTASTENAAQKETLGITRQNALKTRTTDSTEATTQRDARLDDLDNYVVTATVEFDKVYDSSGGIYDVTILRSGYTLVIRNLPPTLGAIVDLVREFKIARTLYTGGVMSVEPETPAPTLVTLIAQQEFEK